MLPAIRGGLKTIIEMSIFAAIALTPIRGVAEGHPQEVLDLMSAHDALATKIQVLQDRVASQPARSTSGAEKRQSTSLRHRNRATSSGNNTATIQRRLAALQQQAAAEQQRISAQGFGIRGYRLEQESGEIKFGDGQHGSRLPTGTGRAGDRQADTAAVDSNAIADARKSLAKLERGVAALERDLKE